MPMSFIQRRIVLPPCPRGFHLITDLILNDLPELSRVDVGLAHLFIQHTSASLTLSENASPEVGDDLEDHFNMMAPESASYRHSLEGPDDMPAHIKAAILGPDLTIPIREGTLALGTWQGIFLCEHRNNGGERKLIVTLTGTISGE